MSKVLHAMYLFRTLGAGQLLKFIVITSLVVSLACAAFVTLFPGAFLDLVESAVLTHGSVDDINALRSLRAAQGGR